MVTIDGGYVCCDALRENRWWLVKVVKTEKYFLRHLQKWFMVQPVWYAGWKPSRGATKWFV